MLLSHHVHTSQPHQKSTICIARMWKRADETSPIGDASPTDYGWKLNQNCFDSKQSLGLTSEPTSLADANSAEATSSNEEESDEAWSDSNENDEEV